MNKRYLIIAGISISLIAMEISWTRIFSAEFFYTFAFLILSTAVLGIGLGGLALRYVKAFNRDVVANLSMSLSGLFILLGPVLVFQINPEFTKIFAGLTDFLKVFSSGIILGLPYFFGGMALSYLFKKNYSDMPRMYMWDMAGAAFGVIIAIAAMNICGTPRAVTYTAMPILFAGLIASGNWQKIIPAILIIATAIGGFFSEDMLQKQNRQERAKVIYTHWDAMAKVKMYDFEGQYRGLNIDNVANSPVFPFDGEIDRPDSLKYHFNINVGNLIRMFDSCRFLSLGAGGGGDVLMALQEGAAEIHAVEVVPHINDMMTEGMLSEYTGNMYNLPQVKVVTEDARAYSRMFENKFDIIYSLSSNSWAALASGAFALAENYLFTEEAFRDYWNALSDKGFMSMEHQFYMPRIATMVEQALWKEGVDDPDKHFAIYHLPHMRRMLLLLSKRELTPELLAAAYGSSVPNRRDYKYLLYPAADSLKGNLINRIVTEGWENVQDSAHADISPCSDDRPFIAQLGLWKNFKSDNMEQLPQYEFMGYPLSKLIILMILALALIIILPLNLIPFAFKSSRLGIRPWMYFFMIGMGFMIIEVILIQQYSLFIGPSVWSIITVLFTMLIASGIGSRYSEMFADKIVFMAIIAWVALNILVFTNLFGVFGGLPLVPRMLISAIMIAPGGFFMGMPFPKAAQKVGENVDWGFAVNGMASVLGSTGILLVAFEFGFDISLVVGALCYLIAMFLSGFNKPVQA